MNPSNPEDAFQLCERRKRILSEDRHMLVIGGPGAGKTTIALLKARRSAQTKLASEQRVLFLSFSNSAIRRIIESAGRILSTETTDLVEIKTYHSFAWEILNSHGYLVSSRRRLKIVPAQDAAVRAAGSSNEAWIAEQNRIFLQEGLVTYDQFAPRAVEILKRSASARTCFCKAYPLILVDEFQDTDEDQWEMVRILSQGSQIVALGDSEQRIYQWRPGVSATRLQDFSKLLQCEKFDFTTENHRSPATGIAGFARSLLSRSIQKEFPSEITVYRFRTQQQMPAYLHLAVRAASREARKRSGQPRPTIAVAARSKTLVRRISDALSAEASINGKPYKPIIHDVLIDQHQVLLAARVIANIMSSTLLPRQGRLADALDRIANMLRSTGTKTNITASDTLRTWAAKCRNEKPPGRKCINALSRLMDQLDESGFTGSPTHDWITVRRLLETADADQLNKVADQARYLRLLRRGSVIEKNLIDLWVDQKNYTGAEVALEQAILQNQIADNHRETANVAVMNMHQLKSREYDAVVLVEDRYSTFFGRETEPPHAETRRLLHVSLTRARHFVLILTNTGENTFDQLFKLD